MRKNKVSVRLFKKAEALTPEPPSFAETTKGVDWDAVVKKPKRETKRRWLIPTLAASFVCLVSIAVICIVVFGNAHNSNYYGTGDERPIVFGKSIIKSWECSNDLFDFSDTSIDVLQTQGSSGKGRVSLFSETNEFCCDVVFPNGPFSSFSFGKLEKRGAHFRGESVFSGETFHFEIGFSPVTAKESTITINFGVPSNSCFGGCTYKALEQK